MPIPDDIKLVGEFIDNYCLGREEDGPECSAELDALHAMHEAWERIKGAVIESALMVAIGDKRTRRNDLIELYMEALLVYQNLRFGDLNRAIMRRWSESGLVYIKRKAWAILEKRCRREAGIGGV